MTNTPLRFGCWNLRGLNDPLKQSEARKWVKNNNLSLVGLIEHKIKEPKAQKIVNIMFPHWHAANNFPQGPLGRILLCWDPLILAIQVLAQSSQFIHCDMHACDGTFDFVVTFIYVSNSYLERHVLWHDIQQLHCVSPWILDSTWRF